MRVPKAIAWAIMTFELLLPPYVVLSHPLPHWCFLGPFYKHYYGCCGKRKVNSSFHFLLSYEDLIHLHWLNCLCPMRLLFQVTSSMISLVSSVLRNGEDDLTQLYALRTIENISSQGGHWSARFTSQDVISNLCYIFRAPGKQESMRLTAGSCLVRLVRFNPSCIQRALDKLSLKDISSSLVKGSPREQQICLNLLNMTLFESHMPANIGRYLPPLLEDKNLVPHLITLTEQGGEILKGKALLFVALLCKNGRRWLPQFFCNAKLLSTVDRLVKDKDNYVKQCLDVFAYVVASSVPSLLETIIADIQQIMGGRRRGQIMGVTSQNSSKNSIHFFPVVLHLLGCSLLKQRVASHQVIQQLANLMKLMESPFQVSSILALPLS